MLSVSRPIEVVVLNCCVTETNEAPCASSTLDDLGEVGERAGEAVDLVDDDDVEPCLASMSASSRCRAGRSMVPPEKPPSS